MSSKVRNKWIAAAALVGSLIAAVGCGKQEFVATSSAQAESAPGNFVVPAKVDILLVEDDTGSMQNVYADVNSALPQFLNNLQSQNWDYHFTTIPLTTNSWNGQVLASKYDPNWGSQWQPPFPGAQPNWGDAVTPGNFVFPNQYSGFLSQQLNYGGSEPGLSNIAAELQNSFNGSGFIRSDALFVVLVVGNGQDTSDVNMCVYNPTLPSQTMAPCDISMDLNNPPSYKYPACSYLGQTNCASGALSLNYFEQQIALAKPSGMMRFYSAENLSGCGGTLYLSNRYNSVSTAIGGTSEDICQGTSYALSRVLSDMSQYLQNVQVGMRTHYLPISANADPTTIVVTRNDGTIIPQSATNGWSYPGYVTNVDLIDYPIPLDLYTGYAVELNGSYELIGSQTATVTYTQAGLHSN